MADPGFDFLNRSDHHDTQRIRDLLESWFAEYSSEARLDLAQRFRSPMRAQHQAAFFELFVHALVRRLGGSMEIHPVLSGGAAPRPDFLIREPSGDAFLEARVAMNEKDEEGRLRNQIDELYGRLSALDSPDFMINVVKLKIGTHPLPGAKAVKHFLRQELVRLQWDDAMAHLESGGSLRTLPRWSFQERDWVIEFLATPKPREKRGKMLTTSVGFKLEGSKWINPRRSIIEAVEAKASKYGDLDLPFVVAVNCLEEADPNLDVFTAFYGDELWTANVQTGEATFHGFKRDGVWMGKGGPQNLRVSAVLVGYPVLAWNFTRAPLWLYHHPFAAKPYIGLLTALPQVRRESSGKVVRIAGASLGEIFDLPREWPRKS
jgi:hypothetical protein